MKKNNISTVSHSSSLKELSNFWDKNDLSKYEDVLEDVNFEVDINKEKVYFPLDNQLTNKIINLSKLYKQPASILLNKILEEKIEAMTH